ncbi:MAG TPA: hypothetical protein VMY39_03280 [Planctomycetota bacterium]|nr:hypothetical protein [Planctomycetota bacterium]
MMRHGGRPETPRGGAASAQRVLRILTLLVAVVGLTYLGVAYWERGWRREAAEPEKTDVAGAAPAPAEKSDVTARVADDDNETRLDLRYNPRTRDYEQVHEPSARGTPKTPTELDVLYGPILDGPTINSGQLHRLLKRVTTTLRADDPVMRGAHTVSVAALQQHPDKYREMPVTVRGKLRYVSRVTFAGEFPEILEGQVLVPGQGVVRFEASQLAPLEVGEHVVVHGLFMQLLTESAERGGQVKTPLVVTSQPLRERPAAMEGPLPASAMIGVVVVLFVIYFVMMFWMRRRAQKRNPILEARRKVRGLVRREPSAGDFEAPGDDETRERESDEDGAR